MLKNRVDELLNLSCNKTASKITTEKSVPRAYPTRVIYFKEIKNKPPLEPLPDEPPKKDYEDDGLPF